MKGIKKQLQGQIEVEAVVLEEMQECLYDSLEWLEVYIEKSGYYLDWQQRKQLPKSIERENVQFMDANEVKGFFSTVLFSLSNFAKTSGVPFVLERLQVQFYSWLDKSGINADNCPKELADCLVNIDNVLNGEGEGFRKARREEVRRNISQMTSEEQERKFYGAIVDVKKNLKDEEAWLEAAKNKNFRDVKMENKFLGNPDQGKEIFKQIEGKNQQISGYLLENGDALINGEEYQPVEGEIQATQEQIENAKQKQQELAQNRSDEQKWVKIGVASGFVALITAFGIKIFGKSLR